MIVFVFIILLLLIFIVAIFDIGDEPMPIALTLAVMFLVFLLFYTLKYDYKQGQIDALTGKIKYELVTNPDSSKTWEEINNGR